MVWDGGHRVPAVGGRWHCRRCERRGRAARTPYGDVQAAEERARTTQSWLSPPPSPPDRATLDKLRHVWALVDGQRRPALLLDWRSTEGDWQGRAIVPVMVDGIWVPHEAWLPADQLEET